MAIQTSDISVVLDYSVTPDLAVYTTDSASFNVDITYWCLVLGYEAAEASSANSLGVPTTNGLVWTFVDNEVNGIGNAALYKTTASTELTETTTLTYPEIQSSGVCYIVGITNVNIVPVQVVTGTWSATSGDITLATIAAGSLVLNFVTTAENNTTAFTAGTNETALSGLTTRKCFVQYSLAGDETVDAGTVPDFPGNAYISIGIELEEDAVVASTTTLHTLHITDDADPGGNDVICESTDFAAGVTVELWPADVEGNKEVASAVVAISSVATASPQYNVTFTVVPDTGVDTLHFIYDAAVGDIKSVTGQIALASATFDSTTAMTC